MSIGVYLRDQYSGFRLFWEDYLPTTEAKITGPLGTIFWILSGISRNELAVAALAIHVIPLTYHYIQHRPFGIDFQYTPIRDSVGGPDFISAEEGRAIIKDSHCRIHAKVELRDSIVNFALRFETDSDIAVELRDIPEPEHIYDRDKNILYCSNITAHRFQLVLDIFDEYQNPSSCGTLSVVEEKSKTTICEIDLIRA